MWGSTPCHMMTAFVNLRQAEDLIFAAGPGATPKRFIDSLRGFHLLFVCLARYCIRPYATTARDLETYHLEE